MIRLGLLGANGKMGTWVERLARAEYAAQIDLSMLISRGDALDGLKGLDGVIDFSSAAATLRLTEKWLGGEGPLPFLVTGTTGLSLDEQKQVLELSKKTKVFQASNFSLGVALFRKILKNSAPLLQKNGFSLKLVETHHQHKKDAPSGTAKTILEDIGSLPVESIREGEVIGEHELRASAKAEVLRLIHSAVDRSIFARGAIDAAIWISKQTESSGIFKMEDLFQP